MHFKFDQNIFLLWLFLILQVAVVICYLSFSSTWKDGKVAQSEILPKNVKFMARNDRRLSLNKYKSYYNADVDEEIYIESENVNNYFTLVNNTVCFKFGTDILHMQRNMGINKENGKCECLPGYHGNDCSLPEVIWRAFIASRQETIINKRTGKTRHIIHSFNIDHPAHIEQAVIKINELFNTVDLFIITEANKTECGETKPFYFKQKLDKGLLKDMQHKILYIPLYMDSGNMKYHMSKENELSWKKSKELIKNYNKDDLFIQLSSYEIANPKALLFFKLYDGFSLPIHFRLKWNVYGYYFQHPNMTRTVTSGYTIKMLEELYKNRPNRIKKDKGLTVGDLNHYGGWLCELCHDTNDIINIIQTFTDFKEIIPKFSKDINVKYFEELMGEGIYVDGKTKLLKNRVDHDLYFSPIYVANNSWKYDSLMINFYNKLDYK